MTQQAQAEALRLADRLEDFALSLPAYGFDDRPSKEAAAELRRLHACVQELEAQQAVPQGWKLVPVKPTLGMLNAGFGICALNGQPLQRLIDGATEKYAAMLAAAPTPPVQRKTLTKEELADYLQQQDAVIIARSTYEGMRAAAGHPAPKSMADVAAQERLIAAKDDLYRSRIGIRCSHCNKGHYRVDGNGYYEFHRCDNCRHVPMWHADGTEFGIQEKPNAPPI